MLFNPLFKCSLATQKKPVLNHFQFSNPCYPDHQFGANGGSLRVSRVKRRLDVLYV